MGVREAILESRIGRGFALAGVGASILAGGVVLGSAGVASAATGVEVAPSMGVMCTLSPEPKASSYIKRCGLSQIAYTYKSNRVVGKKRCYYFLATAWNPCSIPVQYNTQACKAI